MYMYLYTVSKAGSGAVWDYMPYYTSVAGSKNSKQYRTSIQRNVIPVCQGPTPVTTHIPDYLNFSKIAQSCRV